jgi:target of rapamycin complex subunit LST8
LEHQFQAHDTYLLKCLISPDHHTIATTSADHTIKLWKYSTANPTVNSALNSNTGGADSSSSATSTQPSLTLTRCLTSHQRWVWDAVFSADSSYMVSASSDLSAKLWDLRSGDTIRNYLGHSLSVCAVALNDNNV